MPGQLKQQIKDAKKQGGLLPELDLSGNGLRNLDKVMKDIEPFASTITSVDLSFNAFATFPTLSFIPNLTSLNMAGNSLVMVDNDDVGNLTRLQELNLTGNPIMRLCSSLFKLTRLQKLLLSNAKLSSLDPLIGNMVKLEDLHLMGNPLTELPATIGNLTTLEILELFGCGLTSIPPEICKMTRLMELNLGANKIRSLPVSIGTMTRLSNLNLQNNQLTDLPYSIGNCVGLGQFGSGLIINGNPISDMEMRKKGALGADQLLEYLEKRLAVHGPDDVPELERPKPSQPPTPSHATQSPQPTRPQPAQGLPRPPTPPTPTTPTPLTRSESLPRPPTPPQEQSPVVPHPSRFNLAAQGRMGSAPEITRPHPRKLTREMSANALLTRTSAIDTLMNDTRPKLIKLHQNISASTSVKDLMPLAKSVRELKAAVEHAKNLVPEVQPPIITQYPDEDKLVTFKKTAAGALEYVALTMKALKDKMDTTEDEQQLIELAKAASIMNSSMPSLA
jgi:Leucine-rich repeat (LRR) protein